VGVLILHFANELSPVPWRMPSRSIRMSAASSRLMAAGAALSFSRSVLQRYLAM
jgi:hypothetical protein